MDPITTSALPKTLAVHGTSFTGDQEAKHSYIDLVGSPICKSSGFSLLKIILT